MSAHVTSTDNGLGVAVSVRIELDTDEFNGMTDSAVALKVAQEYLNVYKGQQLELFNGKNRLSGPSKVPL